MYSGITDKEISPKTTTMNIALVAKSLKRSRQFVEVCIKHKLFTAWSNCKPNNQKISSRKASVAISRKSYDNFLDMYSSNCFFDLLSDEAKEDLKDYIMPAHQIYRFENKETTKSGINESVVKVDSIDIEITDEMIEEAIVKARLFAKSMIEKN